MAQQAKHQQLSFLFVRRDRQDDLQIRLLSDLCSLEIEPLHNVLSLAKTSPDELYHEIRRLKRSGGVRTLREPNPELKKIQKGILEFLYFRWPIDKHFFGCCPGGSPVKNAARHIYFLTEDSTGRVPRWTVRIDLKDAFPSTKSEYIQAMLVDLLGLRFTNLTKKQIDALAKLLTELTTFKDCLPQGAPTSPYLFNLFFWWTGIAPRIIKLCEGKNKERRVSFYVDDVTISSLRKQIKPAFIDTICQLIEIKGWLKVNRKKTKANNIRHQGHLITGIRLTRSNGGLRGTTYPRLSIPRKILFGYRAKIFRATQILESGRVPDIQDDGLTLEQIFGYIAWVKEVYSQNDILNAERITKKAIMNFMLAYGKFKAQIKTE